VRRTNGSEPPPAAKPLARYRFVVSFGLFCVLSFLLLKYSSQEKRLKRVALTILFFFGMTILTTALDSKRLILECTACDDGIRKLTYNEISYDRYFQISLVVSILYLFISYLIEYNRQRKTDS
jgi:predicted tellurium resistance membrane protein TerC